MIWRWLLGRSPDLGLVQPWNPVIADKHREATERLLLGAAGPARVVGNRETERIVAEREQRVEARRQREAAEDAAAMSHAYDPFGAGWPRLVADQGRRR